MRVEDAMVEVVMTIVMVVVVVAVAILVVMCAEVSGTLRFRGWPYTMHVVELRMDDETLALVIVRVREGTHFSIFWIHEDLVRIIHL